MRPGVTKLLQLATNENPFGTSPMACDAMKAQAPLSNRYPDVRAQALRIKLAAKHGLTPEEVMVTEGATAGLGFISEVFIYPGDEIILTPPTYPSYYNYIKRCRGKLVEVPMSEETLVPDFAKVLAAVTPKTKVVFLCNPNNPTGTLIDSEELHAFQKNLPNHDCCRREGILILSRIQTIAPWWMQSPTTRISSSSVPSPNYTAWQRPHGLPHVKP
jgi:histidinol-phosphate aminotransferase